MNKLLGGLLLFLALALLGYAILRDDNVEEEDNYYQIIKKGTVKIGVQKEAPPFNDVENGKPIGFDYEIAKLIFSTTEFGLTRNNSIDRNYFVTNYEDIPAMLFEKEGESYLVDIVMGGLTFEDGDLDGVVYSIPYIEGFGYSLIAPSKAQINEISDLANLRVGCVAGDQDVLEYMNQFLPRNIKIVELSDEDNTWMNNAFENKEVDAIVYDFPFATVELDNMVRTVLEIKIARLPGSDIGYKIGLRKRDHRLLDEINSAIRKVRDIREYDSLIRKYLPTGKVKKIEAKSGEKTYTVKEGDSLSGIAQKCLGELDNYEIIASLNNIGQPNLIYVNQKLILPDYATCK